MSVHTGDKTDYKSEHSDYKEQQRQINRLANIKKAGIAQNILEWTEMGKSKVSPISWIVPQF